MRVVAARCLRDGAVTPRRRRRISGHELRPRGKGEGVIRYSNRKITANSVSGVYNWVVVRLEVVRVGVKAMLVRRDLVCAQGHHGDAADVPGKVGGSSCDDEAVRQIRGGVLSVLWKTKKSGKISG